MFRTISFQNFKSWKDTGTVKLAPITGFFGNNSSGKSTILQFFLLLKQTVESSDRQRVLHTGDERSYVDLGTFYDIVYNHTVPSYITFNLEWDLPEKLKILNPEGSKKDFIFVLNSLKFLSKIQLEKNNVFVDNFCYEFQSESKTIQFEFSKKAGKDLLEYELKAKGYSPKRVKGRAWPLPVPIKNYGFPDQASGYFQNTGFLSDFVLTYEKVFQKTYYLGPLREYPKRSYSWAGEQPQDVGRRGELAVPALLASRRLPKIGQGKGKKQITIEERIALWLKELGLIHDFNVQAIAKNRKEYEVRVRRFPDTSEVLITDVGFGVSQVLPVLVLCYYAPEGSTIILEQPEIHLHPSVQAGLADVFLDAIKTRKIQIIVESHSEHLLRRLQRRIAEEKDGLTNQDIKLYFCRSNLDGSSNLNSLEIDDFGNIANWPEHFFGDEMGDLLAMTEAAMKRQMEHE
jgi:predicted ATPase